MFKMPPTLNFAFLGPEQVKIHLNSSQNCILHNILKWLSISITVYIDTKHYELKQCNDNSTLDTKSCKGGGERVGLSFWWSAFGLEGMVGKKITSTSFGGAASHGERTLGVGATHARTPDAWATRPLQGQTRAPHGAWAGLPLRGDDPGAQVASMRGADPSATWRLGLSKGLISYGSLNATCR
jgi:hypothetical protein